MKGKKIWFLVVGFVLSFSIVSANTTPDGWIDDFQVAVEKAQSENKNILINFTGSDWCKWCKNLWSEVFSKEKFKEYAEENLVLLYLDFPRYNKISSKLEKQNDFLFNTFPVRGYPTVFLLEPNLNLLLITGYKSGGPSNYVKHLEEDRIEKTLTKKNGKTPQQQLEEFRLDVVGKVNAFFKMELK
ncbi:MAG: thioredoxin family protein [Spirochaetales bacterium]|nr:thioredoxin family protein [Spirochaetales bacterium]